MTKTPDVFDYLKVADKEDIYTALIAYAFSESPAFAMRFCAYFGALYDKKAKLLLRNPFLYESSIPVHKVSKDGKIVSEPHRTKRQIPDLTLVTQDKICIIESKLFAGEGSFQTERYGDIRFLQSIKNDKKLAGLKLEHAKLNAHRCKSREDQCLFYVTINGDRAVNEAFVSVTWSDLITSVFTDLSEANDILRPILIQMKDRFERYPILKAQIMAQKPEQTLDAFLRHSAKHFLLDKDYLFYAYFDELASIRKTMEDRDGFYVDVSALGGVQQIVMGCNAWNDPSFQEVLSKEPLGESVDALLDRLKDEPYPFSQLKIRIVNNKKISVAISYEPNPYLSEDKLSRKYGAKLVERLKQGKKTFEEALVVKGITLSSHLLQVTKTEFLKKDPDLIDKVIAQINADIILIDALTQKEPRYE